MNRWRLRPLCSIAKSSPSNREEFGFSGVLDRYQSAIVHVFEHVRYPLMLGSRPQTLTGSVDSRVGLAAFMLDHDARSHELIERVSDVSRFARLAR